MMHRTLLLLVVLFLGSVEPTTTNGAPPRLTVLTQGPDGHPKGTHEYVATGTIVKQILAGVPDLKVESLRIDQTDEPALSAAVAQSEGVMLCVSEGAKWLSAEPRRAEIFARHAEQKRGLFVLHWAMGTRTTEPIEPFVQLFGASHGGPDRKYRVVETTVYPQEHSATAGLKPFVIKDEFYFSLKTNPKQPPKSLLEIEIDGERQMVAWAIERPNGGRSAGFSGTHFHANWEREEYRRFIGQTLLWTMNIMPPAKDFPPPLAAEALRLPE